MLFDGQFMGDRQRDFWETDNVKVIIAGSRHITDYQALEETIAASGWHIEEVVSGGCHGVDLMGEKWARLQGVPIKRFAVDWARYGRQAGELRNRKMAEYADGLILLWDGKSPGATSMLRESNGAGIPVHTQIYGLDMSQLESTEEAILNHYWHGGGRLVNLDGYWKWENASELAPDISRQAIDSLIRRGMLEEQVMRVLEC